MNRQHFRVLKYRDQLQLAALIGHQPLVQHRGRAIHVRDEPRVRGPLRDFAVPGVIPGDGQKGARPALLRIRLAAAPRASRPPPPKPGVHADLRRDGEQVSVATTPSTHTTP